MINRLRRWYGAFAALLLLIPAWAAAAGQERIILEFPESPMAIQFRVQSAAGLPPTYFYRNASIPLPPAPAAADISPKMQRYRYGPAAAALAGSGGIVAVGKPERSVFLMPAEFAPGRTQVTAIRRDDSKTSFHLTREMAFDLQQFLSNGDHHAAHQLLEEIMDGAKQKDAAVAPAVVSKPRRPSPPLWLLDPLRTGDFSSRFIHVRPRPLQKRGNGTHEVPVRLERFWVQKWPTTIREYFERTKSEFSPRLTEQNQHLPVTGITWYDAAWYANLCSIAAGLDTAYVISGEIRDFLGRIISAKVIPSLSTGYRLIRDAEYEWLLQDGEKTYYDALYKRGEFEWNSSNAIQLMPVATKNSLRSGIYDLHRLVTVWTDTVSEAGTFIIRGDDWRTNVYYRSISGDFSAAPHTHSKYAGIRLARSDP